MDYRHGVITAMDHKDLQSSAMIYTKDLSLSNVSLSSRCQDHLQRVSDNGGARQFAATPGRFHFDRKYEVEFAHAWTLNIFPESVAKGSF